MSKQINHRRQQPHRFMARQIVVLVKVIEHKIINSIKIKELRTIIKYTKINKGYELI